MAKASFLQSTFLGGVWSPNIQGNMDQKAYKSALNLSQNYYPIEEGALTRRQGSRFLGPTRAGAPGRLLPFDFSIIQPYQIEFTDGWMRFYSGYDLVTLADINVSAVSTDNPAKITTVTTHGLTTGNTILYRVTQSPATAPILGNRQFVVTVIDTHNFTIADSVTGASVDGSAITYSNANGDDQITQVFELVSPYTVGSWAEVRIVVNEDNVMLLHPGIIPQVLTAGVGVPFQLNPAIFFDGPYLDINSSADTVTPGGTSGSFTLTFSGITNVNGGAGLMASDVGRLVRLQGGQPAWNSGTAYAKGDVVLGSDNNSYQLSVKTNTGSDPTTDGGVHWTLGTVGIVWTWGKITAVTDTTHCTLELEGPKLPNTNAMVVWQLGLFGNTDGWPTTGALHEGRLWLSGVIDNRIDGGTSNNIDVNTYLSTPTGVYNFAPTGSDGSIADDCGIAAIANFTDVNAVFWMQSDSAGLILGTQAGEILVKASTLDDPLTPTSIQMRRFSTYGCANIDAVRANRELIFVQRQGRKLLELGNYPYGEVAGYYAPNMAKFAEHLVSDGIAEIRWQPDQTPIIWVRTVANELLGVTYKHSPASGMGTADTFTAWHGPHILGSGRDVESISTGPDNTGTAQALYMVTNQPNSGTIDQGVRWVEVLTPQFDDAVPDAEAYFVDGGSTPVGSTLSLIATGGSFNGVTLNGLNYLNGQKATITIGGLDLGDYSVLNGQVQLNFGTPAAFTLSFFQEFGQDFAYGFMDAAYTGTVPAIYPNNSEGSYVNPTETHGHFTVADVDVANNYVVGMNSQDGFIDTFDYATWVLQNQFTGVNTITGGYNALNTALCAQYGYTFGITNSYGSHGAIVMSRQSDLSVVGILATTGESTGYADARTFCPIPGSTYIATTGVSSVSQVQNISVFDIIGPKWVATYNITEDVAYVCPGAADGKVNLYALGVENNYSTGTTIGVYSVINGVFTTGAKIAPSDIDGTWTKFQVVRQPVYDPKDNTIMFGVESAGSPTTTTYLVKYDVVNSAIKWVLALTAGDIPVPSPTQIKTPISGTYYAFYPSETGLYYVNTLLGTAVIKSFQPIFNPGGGGSFFDTTDNSCLILGAAASWVSAPTLLGPYSPVHETAGITSGTLTKLYFGIPGTATYHTPTSVGFTYTSVGQLLRPDFGPDAGTQNGPAFGKKRRIHSATWGLYRSQGLSVGTNINDLEPLNIQTDGGISVAPPTLYSGILWDTVNDDYGFTSQLAWEQTRPYPCLIQAIQGYLQGQDK